MDLDFSFFYEFIDITFRLLVLIVFLSYEESLFEGLRVSLGTFTSSFCLGSDGFLLKELREIIGFGFTFCSD